MATERLYHGGSKIEGNKVLKNDLFHGMFFASDYDAAESHILTDRGEMCYVDIDDDDIYDADEIPYEDVAYQHLSDKYGTDNVELITDLITCQRSIYSVTEEEIESVNNHGIGFDNDAETDFAMQKEAAIIADKLGYKAVAVRDEHGTSYIVVPGVEFTRIEYDG